MDAAVLLRVVGPVSASGTSLSVPASSQSKILSSKTSASSKARIKCIVRTKRYWELAEGLQVNARSRRRSGLRLGLLYSCKATALASWSHTRSTRRRVIRSFAGVVYRHIKIAGVMLAARSTRRSS